MMTYLPLPLLSLLPLLPLIPSSLAASDNKPAPKPCTIHSPSTGSYYDLRPLDLSLQQQISKSKDGRNESWHARGYDYPANFTLNFCGPVIEPLKDIDGIPESRWQNVSAFYKTDHDKVHSIGQSNSELVFRGRKLLLNYTDGSPCPDLDEDGNPKPLDLLHSREIIGDDDDDPKHHRPPTNHRRKTTLLSLLCDRDPTLSTHPALSFLGTPDHCIYVFEARSRYFCGGATSSSEPGSLGPGGVFGVILVIALLAYLVGGCAYQRIVMRQRGWRQCPNFAVWSGIWEGGKDILTILTSTLTHYLHYLPIPSFGRAFNSNSNSRFGSRGGGGGYHRVGEDNNNTSSSSGGGEGERRRGGANGSAVVGGGRGGRDERGRNGGAGGMVDDVEDIVVEEDDENRLIDQLDEEWDD